MTEATKIIRYRRRRDHRLFLERKRQGNDADGVAIGICIVMLMAAALG